MADERDRHLTRRTSDPCVFCGHGETFLMGQDPGFPSSIEIEQTAVFLKTCVIAPRWRWCWREQRLIASLRSPLDERFVFK